MIGPSPERARENVRHPRTAGKDLTGPLDGDPTSAAVSVPAARRRKIDGKTTQNIQETGFRLRLGPDGVAIGFDNDLQRVPLCLPG